LSDRDALVRLLTKAFAQVEDDARAARRLLDLLARASAQELQAVARMTEDLPPQHPYEDLRATCMCPTCREGAVLPPAPIFTPGESVEHEVREWAISTGRSWTPADLKTHLISVSNLAEATANPQAVIAQALTRGVKRGLFDRPAWGVYRPVRTVRT